MQEWQIAISLGQLIGTVGALIWFTRGLKADLQELQKNHDERIEKIQEQHFQLREEIAYKFLRKEDWLAANNKFEAEIKSQLERIEELLRSRRDG